ncbi:hypothetical protein Q2E61_09340 [Microbulbifer thermotolerans]|uniref:hypothetical protein n=1 Tax=Microbulbifer thermotolerans TaxID=252514 RepID=UPI0026738874|nr:hypothetical protein [Microbulbifer thermotolerans]WKT59131.1 hypothetical protein Q2E61_09340 [Microbulbifer thermotolerans]
MAEINTQLSPATIELLEREAQRRGKTLAGFASELVERELRDRTKPKKQGGKIRPFRRP